jgi:hypothetical protein
VFADAVKLFDAEKIVRALNEQSVATWTRQPDEWRATSEKEFSPKALGAAWAARLRVFDRQTIDYLEGLGFTNPTIRV